VVAEAEVGFAVGERAQDIRHEHHPHGDLDAGVACGEGSNNPGSDAAGEAIHGGQFHRAAVQTLEFAQSPFDGAVVAQGSPGVGNDDFSGGSRAEFPRQALEQRHPEFRLEIEDLPVDRR
jgi:hypothetical protein